MTVYHKGYISTSLKWAVDVQIIINNVSAHVFFRPNLWNLNEVLKLYLRLKLQWSSSETRIVWKTAVQLYCGTSYVSKGN